jgi:hypothetical protein
MNKTEGMSAAFVWNLLPREAQRRTSVENVNDVLSVITASAGQAEPPAWEKTRSLLITAVWAFSKIPAHERTADASAQAVDAITDAGSPLSWLLNAAPTPAAAHTYTTTGTGCDRCGRALSEHREGRYCPAEQTAAARDEKGVATDAYLLAEEAKRMVVRLRLNSSPIFRDAADLIDRLAARAAASPVSGAALSRLQSLLKKVPVKPSAITYEKGWELLDELQAIAEIERGERAGGKR